MKGLLRAFGCLMCRRFVDPRARCATTSTSAARGGGRKSRPPDVRRSKKMKKTTESFRVFDVQVHYVYVCRKGRGKKK
jgi:hypothetical protein